MQESEFKALIHLLEDDDPNVSSHIEQALLDMGTSIVSRLEAAWGNNPDGVIQQRIEDIIRRIQNQEIFGSLSDWLSASDRTLVEGWQIITQYRFPNFDFVPLQNYLNRLSHRAFAGVTPDMDTAERCMVINRLLYNAESFSGDRRGPLRPENYFLNTFLDRKKGGPFSLGLLYLMMARPLKLNLEGMLLPNHYFILKSSDGQRPFFIDVFNRGAFFSEKDLRKFFAEHKIQKEPDSFIISNDAQFLLVLVKVIMAGLKQKKDTEGHQRFQELLDAWPRLGG